MKIYLVGGAVRDTYLKKPVSDQDYVVVGSSPQEMLAQGYEQVGASFPVFLHPVTGEEYALARTERKVGAGYHGFETTYDPTVTLTDDLSRRDFTINAMAIDMDTADLIDPHSGFRDLKAKTLRHVGPAFREDPLRVVRMARFLAKLRDDGFTVADETFFLAQQMVRNGELNELPWERFAAEIRKVLSTCSPEGCYTFFEVLHNLRCSEFVTFFAGQNLAHAAKVAKIVRANVRAEHVQAAVVGAVGFNESERAEHVGGSVARDVRLLLDKMLTTPPSSEAMFDLLKCSGAWNTSETYELLVTALQMEALLGRTYSFTAGRLLEAKHLTTPMAAMGAELAKQGFKGAVIGDAIKAARMKALDTLNLSLF